jgi:hypothetical protein
LFVYFNDSRGRWVVVLLHTPLIPPLVSEAEAGTSLSLRSAKLVYRVTFSTGSVTQRKPDSRKTKKKKKKKKEKENKRKSRGCQAWWYVHFISVPRRQRSSKFGTRLICIEFSRPAKAT